MSDVIRSPGRSSPTSWGSPSMLLSWMPVPGTTTPPDEPSEHESDAASPFASTALMCVVPPTPRRIASCASIAG